MAAKWKRLERGIEQRVDASGEPLQRFRIRRMVKGKQSCRTCSSLAEARALLASSEENSRAARKGWRRIEKGIEEATGVGASCAKRFRARRTVAGRTVVEAFETIDEARSAVAAFSRSTGKFGKLTAKYVDADWREFEEAKRHLPAGVSLVEAAIHYAQRAIDVERPATYAEAVKQFLEARKGKVGERQLGHLESAMRELEARWGHLCLDRVTSKMALDALLRMEPKRSARTIRNYYNNWGTFFNWLVRRRYLDESPLTKTTSNDLPTVRTSKKNPLRLELASAMMAEVEENWSQWAVWHALQMFLGFRSSEASRFRSEWIQPNLKRVWMPGWFFEEENENNKKDNELATAKPGAKTRDDWAIYDIPEAFWAWHAAYGGNASEGQIPFPNDWRWFYDLRPAVLKAMGLKEWPENCRKDSFTTYHISLHGHADRTALILRHRSAARLWQSYLGTMVSKEEASRYFEILPKKRA